MEVVAWERKGSSNRQSFSRLVWTCLSVKNRAEGVPIPLAKYFLRLDEDEGEATCNEWIIVPVLGSDVIVSKAKANVTVYPSPHL